MAKKGLTSYTLCGNIRNTAGVLIEHTRCFSRYHQKNPSKRAKSPLDKRAFLWYDRASEMLENISKNGENRGWQPS